MTSNMNDKSAAWRGMDTEGEPIAKRRSPLTSKAKSCAECRRLKLKCNQVFPCLNCKRRGTETICPDGALKTIRGRKLILDSTEILHGRIAALEEALQKATAATESDSHPLLTESYHLDQTPPSATSIDTETDEAEAESSDMGRGRRRIEIVRDQTHFDSGPSQGDAKAGTDSVLSRLGHLSIDPARPGVTQFFGEASSLFLVSDREQETIAQSSQHHNPTTFPFRPGWIQSFVFERDSAMALNQTLSDISRYLPIPQEALRLSESYFENVTWGTIMLDKETFQPEFLNHCYSTSPPDAQRLAVVFLVLAVGAMFDPSESHGAANKTYARDYFALGRACLSLDSTNSLVFVQAIHVLVNWLTNVDRAVAYSQSTWQLLGMGMRVIQALGLHRDPSHYGFPPAVIEQRRRIFWEMYAFDTRWSMNMGRPQMLAEYAFDVRYPSIPPNGDRYHDTRYRMTRHYARVNEEQSKLKPSSYATILQLDRDIRKFQNDLPDEIKQSLTNPDARTDKRRQIQRLAIHNHLNVVCIFLHRGWFAKALLDRPDEPLHSKYSPSYVGCLEASKALLTIVRQLASIDPEICRRRWMFLMHAFSACACLASAVIRAPMSLMAQSSLWALQQGIKLFEDANKSEELAKLNRLLKEAERIYTDAGKALPTDEEDLAMIGRERKHSQAFSPPSSSSQGHMVGGGTGDGKNNPSLNTSSTLPFASPSTHNESRALYEGHMNLPAAAPTNPQIFWHTNNASPIDYHALQHMFDISPLSDGNNGNVDSTSFSSSLPDTSTSFSYQTNDNTQNGGLLLNGLNWGDQGWTVPGAEFDFEAFLANTGLNLTSDPPQFP